MTGRISRTYRAALSVTAAALAALDVSTRAEITSQQPPRPAPSARATAPIDLTGYWVSVVTEDWLWRMVTPEKGDFSSIPLNEEGRKVLDAWDPRQDEATGNQCKAYGAAAIMRVPGRLHVTWENDSTLRIDTDAGQQTRLFHFDKSRAPGRALQWQGHSVAEWESPAGRGQGQGPGQSSGARAGGAGRTGTIGPGPGLGGTRAGARAEGPAQARSGSLKVVTTHMRPGYYRKNGVPYSENAVLTEHFDRFTVNGVDWFTVTTIVEDPKFLTQPYITSWQFKREPNNSKWNPTPCQTT